MDEGAWLVGRFRENQAHVWAMAYRKLVSLAEVDDAVQQARLRLSRCDTNVVENLGGGP